MHEVTSTITSKGQVTIPKRVREELGLKSSDQVTFVIVEPGKVEIRPVKYTLEDLRGIVPALPGRETEDFDDLIAEAMDDAALRIMALDDE